MRKLHLYWRPLLIGITFLTSFVLYLNSGTLTGSPLQQILTAIYYAISLFFLGGSDNGLPADSDTPLAILLWICYLLSPLLTVSYVIDFIHAKLLNRVPRRLQGHTILCGMGRNGRLIYELARQILPRNHKIIIIEQNVNNPHIQTCEKDPFTWWVKNDFTQLPVLQAVRVDKASRIVFSTNQDLENLNAVVALHALAGAKAEPAVFCHLGDLEMLDNFSRTLFREPAYQRVHVFNGYQCATRRLYQRIEREGLISATGTVFLLFGYGRFARMLFDQIAHAPERTSSDEIIIVTEKMASGYDLSLVLSGHSASQPPLVFQLHRPILGDMHDPDIWQLLAERLGVHNKRVIAFVCRDHDVANLDLAISIKLKGPERLQQATFICRIYAHTVQEINEMLDHRLTPHQNQDVILFPLQAELKNAFREEIFRVQEEVKPGATQHLAD